MLEIEHLSFAYERYSDHEHRPVFTDIDLKVGKGKKLLILGAPDSGKSTLARIICNLIPRFIAGELHGSITMDGQSIENFAPWELTDRCTLIAQNPQEQLLMTTCGDEVAFPLESLGMRREQLVGHVHQSLRSWGLSQMIDVNPQEMSGGEQKRLLLAIADAIDAPLWIMDEPFDDLDETWRSHLLQKIQRENKSVVIFGSRYLEEFRGSFDSYALLRGGSLVSGSEEEVVLAFDRECDLQFSPTLAEISIPQTRLLEAKNLSIVHPRRSVSSTVPFTLKVNSFHVESGEVVALVGPNGSGKSTLSRVLCGLDSYYSGSIELDGKSSVQKSLQSHVGYLFQNPDYGIFLPTVRDELGWSLRHIPQISSSKRGQLIEACAKLFHLSCDDNPTMMGYGAKKHLQAAVYYLLDRPFLIIDELDSGVTYAAAFEIVSLLRSNGAAIVLITHDKTFAKNLAQRQYSIKDGAVLETEVGS
jgi:energy-coupling factor transport system ATP-binding protein